MENNLAVNNHHKYHELNLIEQLWQKMDQIHMSYLELDESSAKIEQRTQLEACIEEFLCLVAHEQKFTLNETFEVFHRSVAYKKDFSGYKAATGWNTIQMYAANLLTQPWRKEYKQIKLYSGFYMHQVEANLVGAERMFEAMGYKHIRESSILILDEPPCPDRLYDVSRDCLIAYVECQVLKRIWEEISPIHDVTWMDVLDFRRNHICDIEQCTKAIKCLWNQRAALGLNMRLPEMRFKEKAPVTYKPEQCYHTCSNNPPSINHPVVVPGPSNGYYYSNGYRPCCSVPMEPRVEQIVKINQSEIGHNRIESSEKESITYDVPPKNANRGGEVYKNTKGAYDDWEYVYRNLEHKGYSKDLGERGDILSSNLKHEKEKLVLEPSHPNRLNQVEPKYSEPMKSPKQAVINHSIVPQEQAPSENVSKKDHWECPACTFMNPNLESTVCAMCSKTRSKPEPPMEIGGAECSKCTLVNPKNAKICLACSSSLENSPTYI